MSQPMIRYRLCPLCHGAGSVQARQGGSCPHCTGTGEVQVGGRPRFRVHQDGDGRWSAVSIDASVHQSSLLCCGCPTREAAAAHAERLGYLADARQGPPPGPATAGDLGYPGGDASGQLTLELPAATQTIHRPHGR